MEYKSDTIVKWIFVILITGFISQFGKKFAEYIIKNFTKKNKDTNKFSSAEKTYSTRDKKKDKNFLKIIKKTKKNELKRQKKNL